MRGGTSTLGCQASWAIGEVVLDASAEEVHHPDWQHFEHGLLRLNGAALACFVQSG
jgi:hypothetical protein